MKRLAVFALPFAVVACGDNLKPAQPVDAAIEVDAAVDAAVDAPIDATPVTYSGTISLLEAKLLNPGNSGTFFGQGLQASITFTSSEMVPAPILEEQPGSPLGCKAWSYTPAQTAASIVGLNEGSVQINTTAGTVRPALPACAFTPTVGYLCPENTTRGTLGTVAIVAAGATASLTVGAGGPYTDANSVGRYVSISGAVTAANNGAFPIVARPNANTIVYVNPAAAAEVLPATAVHLNLAAVGPTPSVPDPGFLSDDVAMNFVLTAGGDNHIATFTATTGAGTVGDNVGILTAEAIKLNAIPTNGSAFTIACDGANCGTASGTLINIITTDASTVGVSPFAMPLPTTKRVQVRCAALGATSITVPAAYSALLQTSGAKRIQSTFIRPTLMGGGPANVNSIAGHAIVGYTNIP